LIAIIAPEYAAEALESLDQVITKLCFDGRRDFSGSKFQKRLLKGRHHPSTRKLTEISTAGGGRAEGKILSEFFKLFALGNFSLKIFGLEFMTNENVAGVENVHDPQFKGDHGKSHYFLP